MAIPTSLSRRTVCVMLVALAASLAASGVGAATLSVGPTRQLKAPCAAIAIANPGDTIEIDGNNTYSGDVCGVYANNLTIRGIAGIPKINAAGRNAMGKGTWVVIGNDIVVENVEMSGASVPDRNGAALRLEGTNFTLRGSFLHDNENGILANPNPDSSILIETSEFAHNGFGDGFSHNLYINNAKSVTFRYNYSHDANVGHNFKSRAQLNIILYNRFSSLPTGQAGAGQPSYEIDLPNAGTAYVIGNIIQQPAANQNPSLLAFGEEGASNAKQDLYVVNNTFLNDDSSRGTFIFTGGGVSTPVLMQNNIFGGVGTVNTQASAVDKTNYRALAPGFVSRANYDLRPTDSLVINSGSAPGASASGFSLVPTSQYVHVASSEVRPVSGVIDIGAYEAASAPAPAPRITPSATDKAAPTVSFTSPANGASVSRSFQISVTGTDNMAVTIIALYIDSKLVSSGNGSTLSYSVATPLAAGQHTLTATAYDAAKNRTVRSIVVTVTP